MFDGNNADNKNNGVARDLPEMIYAQAIRLYPTQWNNNISMRFDVHGCQWGEFVTRHLQKWNNFLMASEKNNLFTGWLVYKCTKYENK